MPDSGDIPPTLASLRRKASARRSSTSPQSPSSRSQPDLFSALPVAAPVPRPPRPAAPPLTAERHVWSVRALVTDVRQRVEAAHSDLWVQGEISNCRPASSGHIYFTLKDGEAQLPVVLFRRQAQLLRFRPQDGLAVLVRGRVSVYESRGQLQLIAETLEPRGAGALQLAFDQLKQKLRAEGLFDQSHKRPLPLFPRCIGVVTSPGGAVIRDIVNVVRRRHARLNLLIYPAVMQGSHCCHSVAAGIRWFNAHSDKVDLILIARGGGSIEDLSGFNDEALARIIAASRLPVVSAVGHETDFTIADFVADLRAATPSAAAELITAAQHRIEDRVLSLEARANRAIRFQLMHARQRFSRLASEVVLRRLRDAINGREQRVDDLRHRLEAAIHRRLRNRNTRLQAVSARLHRQDPAVRLATARRRLEHATHRLHTLSSTLIPRRTARLDRAAARLHALSPLAVLNRGYALVYLEEGLNHTLLRASTETAPGQNIRARLAAGSLKATITETTTS